MRPREILSERFPLSSTEAAPRLERLFTPLIAQPAMEGIGELLNGVKKALGLVKRPNVRKFESARSGGRELARMVEAVKTYYDNPTWLEQQRFVTEPVDGKGIVETLTPVKSVADAKRLVPATLKVLADGCAELERKLKAREQQLQPAIRLLERGQFAEADLKQILALLDKVETSKVKMVLPMGNRTIENGVYRRDTAPVKLYPLPALTAEEVRVIAGLLCEVLKVFEQQDRHLYEFIDSLYTRGDDEDWKLWTTIGELEPEIEHDAKIRQLYDGWYRVAAAFTKYKANGLFDAHYRRFEIAMALARWIDRSIR